jgi:hypothetical protein
MSQSVGGSQRQRRAVRGLPPPVQEEIEFEEPVAPILHFNLQNDDPPTDEQMDDNTSVTQPMSHSQNSRKAIQREVLFTMNLLQNQVILIVLYVSTAIHSKQASKRAQNMPKITYATHMK